VLGVEVDHVDAEAPQRGDAEEAAVAPAQVAELLILLPEARSRHLTMPRAAPATETAVRAHHGC
jgi:hypothetical protein